MKKYIRYVYLLLSILFATAGFAQSPIADTTVNFKVSGLCVQCKNRIENAAKGKGVARPVWNDEDKILSLSYNPAKTTLEKIQNRIVATGHDVENKKASTLVYNSLPACCRYRDAGAAELMESTIPDDPAVAKKDTAPSIPDNIAITLMPDRFIKGVVTEENKPGVFKPLTGATVTWLGTADATVTDADGNFKIKGTGKTNELVISYSGYKPDTVAVTDDRELKIILASKGQLQEVRIVSKQLSTYVGSLSPIRTQFMNERELFKAACCNLSESFETNPSVDVSFNDAVTGSKQIQLLGISGNYTQLTVENLPGPRGLATPLGLNSIPGTWIEGIQLTKGTGSVANGFESIAGQINVELKKPQTAEKLYANVYTNSYGKTDLNLNLSKKIGKKWATSLMMHDDFFTNKKLDFNKDGFRDLPTGNLVSFINRWSYDNGTGLISQFGIKYLDEKRTGGQVDYSAKSDKFSNTNYGLEINTKRTEAFGKLGYVFPQKKYKSIGLQLSAFDHNIDSYFGNTVYKGQQQNFYSNLIYQSIIKTTAHKFRTGLSFVYDKYNEMYKADNYKRTEAVPGAFFEYTYTASDKFSAVAGLREDYNSLYGFFTTPRLNLRYEPVKGTVIRGSIGRGQRTGNIFAENNTVFASARNVRITTSTIGKAYGLSPEVAWNKGISVDHKFKMFGRDANANADFFRNDFVNKIVVDLQNPREVHFYDLTGRSFSNSFQTELYFEPINNLNMRFAYRLYDVKTTYFDETLRKPLVSKHRAFSNLAYEKNRWKLDYTFSYNGSKRIPSTKDNPEEYRLSNFSPSYILMNAQVTKSFGKKNVMDVYLGSENLTNYFQRDPIISAAEPFSPYFDAALVWGPVSGRMVYAGWRLKIK